jgi:hypothetical protein
VWAWFGNKYWFHLCLPSLEVIYSINIGLHQTKLSDFIHPTKLSDFIWRSWINHVQFSTGRSPLALKLLNTSRNMHVYLDGTCVCMHHILEDL